MPSLFPDPLQIYLYPSLRQDSAGDITGIAEGLDPGQGQLHALPLPLPPCTAVEMQLEAETSSLSEKLGDSLDLEFPPLLAAKAAPHAGEAFSKYQSRIQLKVAEVVVGRILNSVPRTR